ncbi:hypothetical protein [Bradyrhizobium sp. LHD-71]|uniref:hypothetical protein n=1 Tax=Bradyrhizobium sp. LHD-71 TaxID=3072141 RepID=UPI00280E8F7A|nr:hypothetical protein [Bradyrhizobium sp. LHD-71]MDQ8727497.1 hypothetical protein [Bradyrhizobium sp. LHD-71]
MQKWRGSPATGPFLHEADGAADPNQGVARDRRPVRAEHLNEEEIVAVEASEN